MEPLEQRTNDEARGRRKKPSPKSHTVKINESLCKGCLKCISTCPMGVLVVEESSSSIFGLVARVEAQECCIGCMTCELNCPDFAVVVDYEAREVKE